MIINQADKPKFWDVMESWVSGAFPRTPFILCILFVFYFTFKQLYVARTPIGGFNYLALRCGKILGLLGTMRVGVTA